MNIGRSLISLTSAAGVLSLIIALPVIAQSGGGFDLSWSTIDGGGGSSTGGDYALSGTIGQPDPGTTAMTGGDHELVGGFWAGISRPACTSFAPVDFDQDCDVDQDDVDAFSACTSGPDLPLAGGCEDKDLDHDNDVDQKDFATMQLCLTGANIVADPNCAD